MTAGPTRPHGAAAPPRPGVDGAARKTLSLDRPLAWVVPQHGALEGSVFPVEDGSTFGAGDQAHVQLDVYPGVAPIHARLGFAGGWVLHNLGVVTRVAHRDVPQGGAARVADWDPIELGALRMVFKCL